MVNTSDLAKTYHTSQRSNDNLEIVASRLLKQNKTHGDGMFYKPQATRGWTGASNETSGYRKRSECAARPRLIVIYAADEVTPVPIMSSPFSLTASNNVSRSMDCPFHVDITEHHLAYISLTPAAVSLSQHKRFHPRNMLTYFPLPCPILSTTSSFDSIFSLIIPHLPSYYSRPQRTHKRAMTTTPEYSGSETDLVLICIPFKYEGIKRIYRIRERTGVETGDEKEG